MGDPGPLDKIEIVVDNSDGSTTAVCALRRGDHYFFIDCPFDAFYVRKGETTVALGVDSHGMPGSVGTVED